MKERIALTYTLRQVDIHIQQGRNQQAAQLLTKVLRLLPKHPQGNSRLGTLLMQAGQTEDAIRHFQTACESQPKVIFHRLRLLSAYQQTGDVRKAQQVLEQAAQQQWPAQVMEQLAKVAMEPPGQRQHGLLTMHLSSKDLLTTEIAARLFIDDYPDHPLGWQILGALLYNSGKFEESLAVVQQTVGKFPKDANSHNNLAQSLLALHRYKEALSSSREALKLNPGLAQARAHERLALDGLEKM